MTLDPQAVAVEEDADDEAEDEQRDDDPGHPFILYFILYYIYLYVYYSYILFMFTLNPQAVTVEEDADDQPRVFSLQMDTEFWTNNGFAQVSDPKLNTPKFSSGNHPINGMDYYQHQSGEDYLVAAARNDEEIWFIPVDNSKQAIIVPVHFMAQVMPSSEQCPDWELMDNASIEGVAVDGETLWLINDPWKQNYLKNVKCEANKPHYEKMAPLLFKMNVDKRWFEATS